MVNEPLEPSNMVTLGKGHAPHPSHSTKQPILPCSQDPDTPKASTVRVGG